MSLDIITNDYLRELSSIVVAITRQFAVLHNAVKFDALHVLSAILSSKYSGPLYDSLRVLPLLAKLYVHAMVSWPFYRTVLHLLKRFRHLFWPSLWWQYSGNDG